MKDSNNKVGYLLWSGTGTGSTGSQAVIILFWCAYFYKLCVLTRAFYEPLILMIS